MPIIVCKPKSLPLLKLAAAAQRAIEINPANATEQRRIVRTPVGRRGGQRRLADVVGRRWASSGVRLSVSFMDSPPRELRVRILQHMNAWGKSANVRFSETQDTGEVRIARLDSPEQLAGYWSYIGTEILEVPEDEPTLNLEGFTVRTSDAEFRRAVRHEAGHTLGFEHEHMRTELVKKIDRAKAIAFFDEVHGWTPEEVEEQVLTPLRTTSIMGTAETGPHSIMCYHIPAAITKDGKAIVTGKDISPNDFAFAASLYPKQSSGHRPLSAGSRSAVERTASLPPALAEAARRGELVLYVGSGLSAPAGFPTWGTLVRQLFEWRSNNAGSPPELIAAWKDSLEREEFNTVADSILSDPAITPEGLASFLRPLFDANGRRSPWIDMLPGLQPSAVLSTNFGTLLEQAFPEWPVYTPFDAEAILEAHTANTPHVIKLYGRLQAPSTILLSPLQFEVTMTENRRFANYMEALFAMRTILFVGASVDGMVSYLRGLRLNAVIPDRHFALIADEEPGWRTRAEAVRSRFGITFLPFSAHGGYAALGPLLDGLRDAIGTPRGKAITNKRSRTQRTYISRVELERIGPFDRQEFELTSSWNALIGDNGVGKSTVLKAIAVAMCGDDAMSYAGRIVKTGATHGIVTLHTSAGAVYRTDIYLRDALAEVRTLPARPIEADKWLAIGFPPLRSMPWTKAKLLTHDSSRRLTAADLMPLLTGDPDTRSESVRDWLLGLENRIREGRGPATSARVLRDRFVSAMEKLLALSGVRFGAAVTASGEIRVRTAEGDLPLEAISQGAASLFGWVGVLLQRQADLPAYDRLLFPTLVLVDEIDAHMHPGWQWTLVDVVNELCPDVQFIVTTHSPLIVGSMDAREVHALERRGHKKQVVVTRIEESLKGYRADQILTHEVFGMHTTRSRATVAKLERYEQLHALSKRSTQQEQTYKSLAAELRAQIPGHAERREDRERLQNDVTQLEARIGAMKSVNRRQTIADAGRVLGKLLKSRTGPARK
jgi:predicted ATPase